MQNIDQYLLESITNSQKNSVFHEGFDSIIRFLNASTFYGLLTPCTNFGVWLQYTSRDFRRSVDVLGARLEYIYVNTPQQNNHIESFHKSLKKEYVWPHEFEDAGQAEVALLGALEDYNQHRIHSAIGYMTPNEFAARWEETKAKEVANR